MGRNDLALWVQLDGELVSHFRLKEFENEAGLAMVHSTVVYALERVRRDLCRRFREEVYVIITDGVRTQADLERLAAKYGWIDEGGKVARDSKHLWKYGGIAVDLKAVIASSRSRVAQRTLGQICREYFDWVKDDYADGHVHADNRSQVG